MYVCILLCSICSIYIVYLLFELVQSFQRLSEGHSGWKPANSDSMVHKDTFYARIIFLYLGPLKILDKKLGLRCI